MPDLQEDLQALADRKASESAGDFDSVLTAARSRKRRLTPQESPQMFQGRLQLIPPISS